CASSSTAAATHRDNHSAHVGSTHFTRTSRHVQARPGTPRHWWDASQCRLPPRRPTSSCQPPLPLSTASSRLLLGYFQGEELRDAGGDGIADAAEDDETLLLGAGGGAGIGEAPVLLAEGAGEEGALFGRVIADGDDKIKGLASEGVEAFGALAGDIHAKLGHG